MASTVRVNFVGEDSSLIRSMNRVQAKSKQTSSKLSKFGKIAGAGVALGFTAAAAAATAFAVSAVKAGVAYTDSLNTLQAVTHATDDQMKAVSATAVKLGADLTLPATSAADAADAMVELAKGGFSVADSQKAALGTLQLATAAGYDAAQAAQVQVNLMNEFSISATGASHVADVLANTANAASGGIEDIAVAMTYVGPVAHSVGAGLNETATALGVMANKGILADKAGTALRGLLVSFARPSKMGQKGLDELGVSAFDASGKFLGFRNVIQQMTVAQKNMTKEQFLNAAAMAFGKQNLAGIVALASGGAGAFDKMAAAVARQGGAAEVAAAKSKGLGGAMRGLKSQVETIQIQLYQKFAPALEKVARWLAERLPGAAAATGRAFNRLGAWVQENVVPKLQQFSAWFQTKGIPWLIRMRDILNKDVHQALEGLRQFVASVTATMHKHRAQINEVVHAWQDLVKFLVTKVMPLLGPALKLLFIGLGKLIEDTATTLGVFLTITNTGLNNLKWAIHAVKTAFDGVKAAVKGVIDMIKKLPTHISISVPGGGAVSGAYHKVFGASGGIVTRPTMATIGEAGPEAVIPLNRTPGSSPLPRGGGGGGGGGDTHFHFYNFVGDKRDLKAAIREIVRTDGNGSPARAFGS